MHTLEAHSGASQLTALCPVPDLLHCFSCCVRGLRGLAAGRISSSAATPWPLAPCFGGPCPVAHQDTMFDRSIFADNDLLLNDILTQNEVTKIILRLFNCWDNFNLFCYI